MDLEFDERYEEFRPELWQSAFFMVSRLFEVPIDQLLDLDPPWDDRVSLSEHKVQRIIRYVCEEEAISEDEFGNWS